MVNRDLRRVGMTVCLSVLSAFLTSGAARAQDAGSGASSRDAGSSNWEFVLAPYLVGANITGDTKIGRLPSTDLDVGSDDIFGNLKFGFMGRAEALYQQKVGGSSISPI